MFSFLTKNMIICPLSRGAQCQAQGPYFWPSNKVPKRNFQSIISPSSNGCNLLSLTLAKLLVLHINCKNIFVNRVNHQNLLTTGG